MYLRSDAAEFLQYIRYMFYLQVIVLFKAGTVREGANDLANCKGYIPYFFYDYFVLLPKGNWETDIDDRVVCQYAFI